MEGETPLHLVECRERSVGSLGCVGLYIFFLSFVTFPPYLANVNVNVYEVKML